MYNIRTAIATKVRDSGHTVILHQKAFKKIRFWVLTAAERGHEVAGVATIIQKGREYHVTDAYLVEPTHVSGGYVEMNPQALANFLLKCSMEGKVSVKNLRCMWHSHVRMNVFWSGTDEDNARNLFCPDSPWTVNLVTNVQGDWLARMDFPKVRCNPILDIPLQLQTDLNEEEALALRREYEVKHPNSVSFRSEFKQESEGKNKTGKFEKAERHRKNQYSPRPLLPPPKEVPSGGSFRSVQNMFNEGPIEHGVNLSDFNS